MTEKGEAAQEHSGGALARASPRESVEARHKLRSEGRVSREPGFQ